MRVDEYLKACDETKRLEELEVKSNGPSSLLRRACMYFLVGDSFEKKENGQTQHNSGGYMFTPD